jgi:hypothetical protein
VAFSDGAASSRRLVAGLGPTTSSGSAAVRWESTTATSSATTAATRVANVKVAAAEGGRGGACVRVRQGGDGDQAQCRPRRRTCGEHGDRHRGDHQRAPAWRHLQPAWRARRRTRAQRCTRPLLDGHTHRSRVSHACLRPGCGPHTDVGCCSHAACETSASGLSTLAVRAPLVYALAQRRSLPSQLQQRDTLQGAAVLRCQGYEQCAFGGQHEEAHHGPHRHPRRHFPLRRGPGRLHPASHSGASALTVSCCAK